ncbi:MAG: NADH-quinone oxidoreductase subunit NuoH [Verrucomicrobia bacterium]|nr:NADH-quinone oxidoreductase subunit NuoH [Verrucomicrobiota bacterium]
MDSLDQIFVLAKQALLGLLPVAWQPWASAVISVGAILAVFPLLFALTTVVERKALGRMQNRPGPNRVGPWGFLQFAADGIKSLTKEDIVPRAADPVVHFLAPLVVVLPPILAFAVLPVGRNMVALELPETGLLFFLMVGTAVELGVFMAGWSSHNKYSLLGAMRALAQLLSYELPLILSALAVVMLSGSLSLTALVERQSAVHGGFLVGWNVFTPWGAAGALLFFTAALAEANRSPFDLPEAESEIVAGYFTEYSGFKFALFFLGEYLGLFAISGLGITLFLGGWLPPFSFLGWVPSWLWFFGKLGALMMIFIWLRGTLPRLRMDQLMQFAWQFLLPMSLVNLLVAGLWHFTAAWPLALRWLLGAALLAGPWTLYARQFAARHPRRIYRYVT